MVKPLPKWAMKSYAKLWASFSGKEFSHDSASKILKTNKAMTSLAIAQLKSNNWVSVSLDPKDSRKRLYRLVSPEDAIRRINDE